MFVGFVKRKSENKKILESIKQELYREIYRYDIVLKY